MINIRLIKQRLNTNKKIPTNWKWVSLKTISRKITDGSHNPPKKRDVGIPMLSARNILNNKIDFEHVRYISESDFKYESLRTDVENGDVLITTVATIGRVAIVPNDNNKFTLQRSVTLIKPLINSKYLMYCLQAPFFQAILRKNAKGTAQKGIYLNTLRKLEIPLAPFEEQERIVNKIEEVLSELENLEVTLKESLNKLENYLNKVIKVEYENEKKEKIDWVLIDKIGKVVSGGTPSTKNSTFWGSEIAWITPSDLSNYENRYISHGNRFLSNEGLKNSSANLLPTDSVLFSTRAPIGYVVIAKNELATNQGFKSIIPNENINSLYLYYYLKSIKGYAQSIASGTTFLELSLSKFSKLPFPLVSEDRQREVVDKIEYAESYRNAMKKALLKTLDDIEATKLKTLNKAFYGQLCNQLDTDSSVEDLLASIKKQKNEYLKSQEILKQARKKTKRLEPQKLTLLEILKSQKEPVPARKLWQESVFHEDIDKFYDELKKIQNQIKQIKRKEEVFISLT